MSAFETLLKQDAFTSTDDKGASLQWIDADTFDDADGNRHRLQRTNAPETLHKGAEGSVDAGGAATHAATVDLAKKMGFTQVVNSGEKDVHNRFLSDLVNPNTGESFTKRAANEGIQPIYHGFDKDNQNLKDREYAKALKTGAKRDETYVDTEWDKARMMITQSVDAETKGQMNFKRAQAYSGEVGAIQDQIKVAEAEGKDELVRRLEDSLGEISQRAEADTVLKDRHQLTGMANNPTSVAWDQGWNGAREGAFGFLELMGDVTGSEGLKEYGEAGIARQAGRAKEFAKVLTDWKDVDWEKPSTGLQFIINNAAMSLPYMATTTAAAIAGAGVTAATGGGALAVLAGGAIGLGAPASVYSGQVWNEMEGEKSAGIALAAGLTQAALDRLGLGAITGKIIPGKLKGQAIQKIMATTGVTKGQATTQLANATKGELAGFLKDGTAIAAKQLADKKLGMELLKRAGVGGGTEAITEAGQEAIGYIAATDVLGGSSKKFEWEELNERLIAAAIAGGTLGVAFASPGAITSTLSENANIAGQAEAETSNESQAALHAAEEQAVLGYIPTVEENLDILHNEIESAPASSVFAERATSGDANYKALTFADKAKQALLNPLAALQGSVNNVLTQDIQGRSRSARVLSGILGGSLQKIYGGSSLESAKHHLTTKYKATLPIPEVLRATMAQGERVTNAKQKSIDSAIYSQLRAATDKDGNFDPSLIAASPTSQVLINFGNQLNELSNKMYNDQHKYNKELGFNKNYLFKYQSVSKANLHKDRPGFAALLQSEYKYSAQEAAALTDKLADDPNVGDLSEAFSIAAGGVSSGSHKARTLALSENPKFAEYMETDIFANIDAATKAAARYTTHEQYLGKDNAIVSKLLEKMQVEDGLSTTEVDKIAAGIRDFLDAESGNYKRPTSAVGKKLQKYQKNAMTAMTLAGLPLATISSFVELALVNKSLTHDQVFGKTGSLKAIGNEGWKAMSDAMGDVANVVTRKETVHKREESEGQRQIRDLGYKDWAVGAGTVAGVTEINAYQQKIYKTFFTTIGLTQWTDYTRAARAAIGADYIGAKIEILANQQTNSTPRTREVQEAEEAVRNLGINVQLFIANRNAGLAGTPVSDVDQAKFDNQMREGMYNFINEAVALPGAANRPLIYQDPRFALFTQFQGFISAFTANHIPKLWGEQIKRGTPAMKYSAFATMATMIMMGFLSQAAKDEIKYGLGDDEDKTLGNPHLDAADYIRRGVFASGLLGTAERAISLFDPVYESRKDGLGDYIFDPAIGESPALSYIQRVGGAVSSLAEGDVGGFAKGVVKSAPGAGPFSFAADWAEKKGDNWNFNGE